MVIKQKIGSAFVCGQKISSLGLSLQDFSWALIYHEGKKSQYNWTGFTLSKWISRLWSPHTWQAMCSISETLLSVVLPFIFSGGLVINLQRYQWQILRAKMDHLFNEFIKNSIIINGKRRRIQTSSKGENLDVTEHRWRALQECDTSYIFILCGFGGVFLPVKPQEFKNVDKQTLARHILRRQRIQLCLVIYMAVSSPTGPRITRNCGSAHELESPEIQNWVTLLALSWLTLIYLVQWMCYWITSSCRPK